MDSTTDAFDLAICDRSVSRTPIRVTFLSNSYQPQSIRLAGIENDWPAMQRKAWLNDDCSINKVNLADADFRVVGFADCLKHSPNAQRTSSGDAAIPEN